MRAFIVPAAVAVATVQFSSGAFADAAACKPLDQASCTADKYCLWKPEEKWTREGDGAIKIVKAMCAFDAKAAKAAAKPATPPAK